jgi:hypothetical protein
VITLAGDDAAGTALLAPVLRGGRAVTPRVTLEQARVRAGAELAGLPERLRVLEAAEPYSVEVAPALRHLALEVDAQT